MRLNADHRLTCLSGQERTRRLVGVMLLLMVLALASAMSALVQATPQERLDSRLSTMPQRRAQRFLGGRARTKETRSAATLMAAARLRHEAMVQAQVAAVDPSLSESWQPLGPNQIATSAYGNVTGRVTSIAIDPADLTGNTVYVGTTGGGVWKSTNAAGPSSAVSFVPLTDTLPVFSANAGTAAIPSLSVGAISVQSGIVLAGTGDPNDATDSYYGSGLLRSFDGGLTWALIQASQDGVAGNHSFVGLSVAGFAWSSVSSGLVVAAISEAAEGVLVGSGDPDNSVRGLYYSTDAGVTWQMSVVMDGSQIVQRPLPVGSNRGGNAATSVVWNPVRRMFYAVVRYHGYYESADGVTWFRMAQQPGSGMSLTACPTNPGTTGNPTCPVFRGALAVQPATGDTFSLTVDNSNQDQGLWQDVCVLSGSACGGSDGFGNRLISTPLEAGSGSTVIPQADYNLVLSAVPSGGSSNPDTLLLVGTADLYRCVLSDGCRLRNTTNATNGCAAPAGVAGAQHAVTAQATVALPLVYVGNDGGLWRSTDGVNQQATPCSSDDKNHFQNLNSGLGSLAEIVSFAQHPSDAGTLLGGFGANGTASTSSAGSSAAWAQIAAGEGGTAAIDPVSPLNWYISTAAGVSIRHCADGAACTATDFAGVPTVGLPQVEYDASVLDPPWLLDPVLSSEVIIGTCRVWRGPAADGSSWSSNNAISRLLGGAQNSACTAANPVLRSLAAGGPASGSTSSQNAGSTVLYAGMAGSLDGGGSLGGHLFSTQAGATAGSSTAWTDLTGSPVSNVATGFNAESFDISSIAVDPHDPTGRTVYVTIMGFGVAHVFRSIDAGAHWLNISSNLPDAPANGVIVDPNDANTLYVAMDTGVYVATAVTSCASTNCWSVYGLGLPNAPVVQLAVAGTLAVGDGRTGQLRVGTYGRGIWQIPLLTAASSSQPAMTLSPQALTFGPQQAGTASASQTITVTNTGTAPLLISSEVIAGDFLQTSDCIAAAIPIGASCSISVVFQPSTVGTRAGLLTIYGNVAGGQATAALSGLATSASAIVLTPATVLFAATSVGSTTAAQNVTISNTSSATVTLASENVRGDFVLSANTCGASLGPSTGCTVAIRFAPTASGTRTGSLTVTDSVGTQVASLTGTATSPATDTLSPLNLIFGAQQIGTSSVPQRVTLTNTGDVALTLIGATLVGDFTVVNACGNSLNAHASCSMTVSYVPKNVGAQTGTLTVVDASRSQTVMLTGSGLPAVGVSLVPFPGLSFMPTGVGITSAGQTVTFTNNKDTPLVIGGFVLPPDFVLLPGSNTCGSSLASFAACTLQIAFAPTTTGIRSGLLSARDDADSSPQTLTLTGTGVDFSIAAGNSAVTVSSGQSAVYSILLSSVSGVPGRVALTCSGVPVHATCLIVPASVAVGSGTATAVVTVATGVAPATTLLRLGGQTLWIGLLLPLGLGLSKRRRLLSAAVLCGLLAAAGCGSSRLIPGSGATAPPPANSVTPSGASTIVVSASSAGLVRTVNLSLTIK